MVLAVDWRKGGDKGKTSMQSYTLWPLVFHTPSCATSIVQPSRLPSRGNHPPTPYLSSVQKSGQATFDIQLLNLGADHQHRSSPLCPTRALEQRPLHPQEAAPSQIDFQTSGTPQQLASAVFCRAWQSLYSVWVSSGSRHPSGSSRTSYPYQR